MTWPTQPDGTVDWALVFNAPDTGLIPMVHRADTLEKLQACYHVVILGLFSRNSDVDIRNEYVHAMDHYYGLYENETDLPGLKTKISGLLQQIMHERIDRAKMYGKLKEIGDERRMPEDNPLKSLSFLKD